MGTLSKIVQKHDAFIKIQFIYDATTKYIHEFNVVEIREVFYTYIWGCEINHSELQSMFNVIKCACACG